MATEFVCPQCKAHAASPKAIPVGAMVRCPKCSFIFKYEGLAGAAKPAEPAPKSAVPAKPAAPAKPAEPARSSKITNRPEPAVARRARDDDDYDDRPRSREPP